MTNPLNLPRPVTLAAGHRFRVLSSARTFAGVTPNGKLKFNVDLVAKDRLNEVDVGDDFDVLTTGRARRTTLAPATAAATEEGLEDVTKTAAKEVISR